MRASPPRSKLRHFVSERGLVETVWRVDGLLGVLGVDGDMIICKGTVETFHVACQQA